MPRLEPPEVLDVAQEIKKRVQDKTGAAHRIISLAPFMPRAERELSMEDPVKAKGFVGDWERFHVCVSGRSVGMTQVDPTQRCSCVTHCMRGCWWCLGRDFVVLGDPAAVNDLHELQKIKDTAKLVAQIGGGNQEREAVILNGIVR